MKLSNVTPALYKLCVQNMQNALGTNMFFKSARELALMFGSTDVSDFVERTLDTYIVRHSLPPLLKPRLPAHP